MRRASLDLLLGAALLLGMLSPAHGAQRAFVASYGVDAGNVVCALATPCRSFQQAITNVDPGGEVVVIDSAGYGAMTIGKSVAVIVPTGLHAGLTVFGGTGVEIAAPGNIVTLRGLYLNGLGGFLGIRISEAAEVHVENCMVAGFLSGIFLSASGTRMWVLDTIVRDNASAGMLFQNGGLAQRVTVVVDRARVEGNGGGGQVDGGITALGGADVTISNSVLSGNVRGVLACGAILDTANAVVVVEKSVITFNGVGLLVSVSGDGTVPCAMLVSDTDITRNSIFGIEQQGASVATSYGGNTVFNNAGNTFGLTVGKI